MKLTKIRIKKLLENKSNDFKRKYYALSTLSTNDSIDTYEIYAEACVYLENLIKTEGKIPEYNAIINLYKESLIKENKSKRVIDNNVKFINRYCDLSFSKKLSLFENIVEEELVSAGKNYLKKEIDNKLFSVMIESFNTKKSLFLESTDLNKDEKSGKSYLKDLAKKVITIKNIPFIENTLGIFLPKGYFKTDEEMQKHLTKVTHAILAKYDLIVNKRASKEDLKKLHIISIIDYHLNIAQEPYSDEDIKKMSDSFGLNDYTLSSVYGGLVKKSSNALKSLKSVSLSRGKINDDVKSVLKAERNRLVNLITFTEYSINTNNLNINDLYLLLSRCIKEDTYKYPSKRLGKYQTTDIKVTDLEEPEETVTGEKIKQKTELVPITKDIVDIDLKGEKVISLIKKDMDALYSDKSFDVNAKDDSSSDNQQQYLKDLEDFERAKSKEDKEEMEKYPDFLDAKSVKQKGTDPNYYPKLKPVYKPEIQTTMDSEGNVTTKKVPAKDIWGNRIIVKMMHVHDKDGNPIGEFELEDSEDVVDISDYFLKNKSQRKSARREELEKSKMLSISSDPSLSAPTPEDYYRILAKGNKKLGKSKSYQEIADLSSGRWKNHSGARQDINKYFVRSMFYSANNKLKSSIYKDLLVKYIYLLEKKDLVDDNFVNLNDFTRVKDSDESKLSLFEDINNNITEADIEEYLTGELEEKAYSDDMSGLKFEILDDLISESISGFRIFVTHLMRDFYDKNIWKKLELDLTYAVKEYFNKNFPNNRIAENLAKGRQVRDIFKVKHSGQALFNTIIYWVMRSTAMKGAKGQIDQKNLAKEDVELRKSKFRAEFTKAISNHNNFVDSYNKAKNKNWPKLIFSNLDMENLVKDISYEDPSNSIIGKYYEEARYFDNEKLNRFNSWLGELEKKKKLFTYVSVALITNWYYKSGFILSKIQGSNDSANNSNSIRFVLKHKEDNSIHLLAKKEEMMIKAAAEARVKEYEKTVKSDLTKYEEYASNKYKNPMPKQIRDRWISDNSTEEALYYDPTKKRLVKVEINMPIETDGEDNLEKCSIFLPDAEDSIVVNTEDLVPLKIDSTMKREIEKSSGSNKYKNTMTKEERDRWISNISTDEALYFDKESQKLVKVEIDMPIETDDEDNLEKCDIFLPDSEESITVDTVDLIPIQK